MQAIASGNPAVLTLAEADAELQRLTLLKKNHLDEQFPADVYLEGPITRSHTLSRDHQGPRAVLNALERLATGYASESVRVRQDLSIAESQLRDYQARLGKPFRHDTYLTELTGLRDQLKAGLSARTMEEEGKAGPTTAELADKIKAIKAANTIEATPQRARQKHSTAEEPITARIRRRQEGHSASDQAIESDAAPEEEEVRPTAATQNSPGKPPMTFQERIALERQSNRGGQSPG